LEVDHLAAAEASFAAGEEAEADNDPACIDHYFTAACDSWPLVLNQAAWAAAGSHNVAPSERYHASLQAFLAAAQHFGRFHFTHGVLLGDGRWIRVSYHGFLWNPEEMHSFVPAEECQADGLSNRYGSPGVGVPYVMVTGQSRRPFVRNFQPLAATAVLAPSSLDEAGWTLEFYDPQRVRTTQAGWPLAFDLSAPIAYSMSQDGSAWLENFLWAQQTPQDQGLYMAEPYQPGKIPVVFVHGLASSPLAWAHLANELRPQSWFSERYQIWSFRYDTGAPFLSSAAQLRDHLAAIRLTYDPERADGSLSQIVLIGHSMGGILAKLQVTESGGQLWHSAARQPFETIRADDRTRMELARAFFFRPSPDVAHVVYVATPHRGSGYARRCIGSATSSLVMRDPDREDRHEQLLAANPDAFYSELTRRLPTSIDMLRPESQILQATGVLSYRPGVCLHSIIGDHCCSLTEGRTDGVVPVSSAQLAGVASEIIVDTTHTEIGRHPATTQEVQRILVKHAENPPTTAQFVH
jgi:pimeloyl-ACP methyl ester carboxylesterase